MGQHQFLKSIRYRYF